jgi:hypothetical protein
LWLVDELADDWGTACRPGVRWVWADVRWQARGGAALQVPGGAVAAIADIALIRRAFPGATIWWGHQTQAWWASLPGASRLLSSATRGGLSRVLAGVYLGSSLARSRLVVVGPEARRSRERGGCFLSSGRAARNRGPRLLPSNRKSLMERHCHDRCQVFVWLYGTRR